MDILFNATGVGSKASNLPVIADLIGQGLAVEHPFGGIWIDERTYRVQTADESMVIKMPII